MGNGTDMGHPDPQRKGDHSVPPMDLEEREREWYKWERERNERRRNIAIARGCVVVLLVVAAVLLWIGFMSVLDVLDAL